MIGGGFTGTLTAYLLMKRGYAVELHERGPRFGGLLGTDETPYGSVEWAANGFLSNRLLEDVARDIGVTLIPAGERVNARYFFLRGVRRWPLNPLETAWTGLVFAFRWLTGKAKPTAGEALSDWGKRVLGNPFTEKVLRTAVLGIYASPLEKLSATLVVGRFFEKKPSTRGVLRGTVAPENGMQEWIEKITRALEAGGAKLLLNSTAKPDPNDATPTIVCAHARDIAGILPAEWVGAFARLESPGVVTCTLYFEEHPDQPRGFGILFHPSEGFAALGCLFESDCYPRRSRTRAERYILSEAYIKDLLALDDRRVIELVLKDRARFSPVQDFLDYRVHRAPQGFPVYGLELERALAATPLHQGNIYLHGNFTGRLGLAQIALRTAELVERLEPRERLHA